MDHLQSVSYTHLDVYKRQVECIAQMAEENDSAARSNADTARNLRQLAETLSTEVGRFRT